MTTDEAREAAWREWAGIDHTHAVARTAFNAGWNARGQHDKGQIAALVEAAEMATGEIEMAMYLLHEVAADPEAWMDTASNRLRAAIAALEEGER